ncbi:ATP-dependent DNA helicase, putative [Babesia ovis]|uniref:ATP-dependent DNA helicase, putative n=1 Tax=Babesia ovis TaxID=5869 RepID=A0A9W5T7F4_BABOV|nr:ATP-dependent DNA helicase, putative [Babesia ovis]
MKMNIFITFALLGFCQLQGLCAANQNGTNYHEVYISSEQLVKAVMKIATGGHANQDLLNYTNNEVRKDLTTTFRNAWDNRIQHGKKDIPEDDVKIIKSLLHEDATLDSNTRCVSSIGNFFLEQYNALKEMIDSISEDMEKDLESASVELNNLFIGLYGAEYQKLVLPKPDVVNVDAMFLDLRFGFAPFLGDLVTLLQAFGDELDPCNNPDMCKETEERVYKWVKTSTPNLPPAEPIDVPKVYDALVKLLDRRNSPINRIVTNMYYYNSGSSSTMDAMKRCKQQNSAFLSSVTVLFASILTFTIL